MLNRPFQISAGLVLLLARVGLAAGLVALSQFRGGPAIWLRMNTLQSSGPSQACQAPARLVPGSYQAGLVQFVGGFVLLVYTAGCAEPGQPAQNVQGFAALDRSGDAVYSGPDGFFQLTASQSLGLVGSGLLPGDPAQYRNYGSGQSGSHGLRPPPDHGKPFRRPAARLPPAAV
jgi:hypothetical protein